MSKKNLRYVVFLIGIIIFLFICSVSFILLIKSSNERKKTSVNEKDVAFVSDSNLITIKNIISVSEDFGKNIYEENGGAFGYLEFDVKNNTNSARDYQIYITKLDPSTKEINSSYLTFYLTNSSNIPFEDYTGNKLPSYNDFHYIEDKADSKSIYRGSIDANDTYHFILRVWITDNYVVSNTEESFLFEIGARTV